MSKPTIIRITDRDPHDYIIPGIRCGDAINCAPYVWKANKEALKEVIESKISHYIPTFLKYDPYSIINNFIDIDVEAMKKELMYGCELTSNKYHSLIPIGILTTDISRYESAKDSVPKYMWDDLVDTPSEYMGTVCYLLDGSSQRYMNSITRAYMGHGIYYFGDGFGSNMYGIARLSNGDLLVVQFWVWYNR